MSKYIRIILLEKAPFYVTIKNLHGTWLVRKCTSHAEVKNMCGNIQINYDILDSKNPSDYYVLVKTGTMVLKSFCEKLN